MQSSSAEFIHQHHADKGHKDHDAPERQRGVLSVIVRQTGSPKDGCRVEDDLQKRN